METKKILSTSWGYNMTHNDYALVIEETDKTVKCVMIKSKVLTGDGYAGEEMPDAEAIHTDRPIFRLRKRENGIYSGSYPFCGGSTRKDWFKEWDGKADYYNTMD
jgi:hypothetical protein